MKKIGIIPARFASSRFPGKPLVDIKGKTMIRRVYEQAIQSNLEMVFIATDDERIANEMTIHGANVVMTRSDHASGTDRCAEVVESLGASLDKTAVVINIQGDEPFIDPEQINLLCACFEEVEVEIATLVRRFSNREDILQPNTIKVVKAMNGDALYFSRLPIPYERDSDSEKMVLNNHFQHIGLYGYRSEVLLKLASLPSSSLENIEKLEQLRWLENGYKIRTALSHHESWSVDVPEDLKKLLLRFF